jgi:hypothetical protein
MRPTSLLVTCASLATLLACGGSRSAGPPSVDPGAPATGGARASDDDVAPARAATGNLHERSVTRGDERRVIAWFEAKQAGRPELPAALFVDGRPAPRAEFETFLGGEGLFVLKEHTPMRYSEGSPVEGALGGDGLRTVMVATGLPPAECGDPEGSEGCEGFEWIELTYDASGALVGLHVTAAACPFVYVAAGDAPLAYVGEILRNQNRVQLEGRDALRLAGLGCAAPIRVRVSEEKQELTLLDAIWLEIDGVPVAPTACAAGGAFCADDGLHHRLAEGEVLDLTFVAPAGAACTRVVVKADGHYLPR